MSDYEIIRYEPSQPQYLVSDTKKKIKVCAYCRVSCEGDEQAGSLSSQKRYFEEYFKRHGNWENVGIYADEGISGTSLENRREFRLMLERAERGGIDLILTKEVSRFSRNLLDTLNITYALRNIGVYIYFISDGLNTEKLSDCADLASIANAAEAESRRTSKRVRWGQKEQMLRGVVFGRRRMFGYIINNTEGQEQFQIIEEEAIIIREIFRRFISGQGLSEIARKLPQTSYYKNGWTQTTVLRILKNEKYAGDLTLGKTYTPDIMTHKKKYNQGQSFAVTHKNHHPDSAIITREVWERAKALLDSKSKMGRGEYSKKYWCSGKIFCGICGSKYISYTKKGYHAWICFSRHRASPLCRCGNSSLNHKSLNFIIPAILSGIVAGDTESTVDALTARLSVPRNLHAEFYEKEISREKMRLERLTDMFVDGHIDIEDYKSRSGVYKEQLVKLESELILSKSNSANAENIRDKILQILSFKDVLQSELILSEAVDTIKVLPEKILEIKFNFLEKALRVKFFTSGKGESYRTSFDFI